MSRWPHLVIRLGLPLVAAAALACSGNGATEGTGTTASGGETAIASPTRDGATPEVTPPAIATVTVDVPTGTQSHPLVLTEGVALVLQQADGTRQELANLRAMLDEGTPGSIGFPAVSPDGETVAFVRRSFFLGDPEDDYGDDVYLVPLGGGEPTLVREHSTRGEQVFGLAWRPSGNELLLGRIDIELRDGIPTSIAGAAVVELDVATLSERAIVDGGYDPSLSVDGTRLAYLRLEDVIGVTTVIAANRDGSDPIELVASTRFEVMRLPRISPDGTTVAFVAAAGLEARRPTGPRRWLAAVLGPLWPTPAEAHGIPMDIWLADIDTTEVSQLTAVGEDDPFPAWAPDGLTVVFVASSGLYEASTEDGAVLRIGDGRFDGQVAVPR